MKGLVKQHIDSFNYFVDVDIKNIVRGHRHCSQRRREHGVDAVFTEGEDDAILSPARPLRQPELYQCFFQCKAIVG